MLLTRSPLEHPRRGLSVRLACVKHAASVRPEPGSNSPSNAYNQTPKRSHSQQRENLNPKRAKLTHSKSNRTSHHGGDRTIRQYQTKLALTIGTLLSSQRTDAHLSDSFESVRGPDYCTRTSSRFQIAWSCRFLDSGRSVLRPLPDRAATNKCFSSGFAPGRPATPK